MKKNLTELVFVLDRSGSMAGLEKDTIGGFNSMIKKQKKEKGEAIITTVLFDHENDILHDRLDIKGIKLLDENDYYVNGSTALLDCLGFTISKTLKAYKNTIDDQRPEKVIFVITTDGQENSSKEYDYKKVKTLIESVKKEYAWEFIFLGANIDAEVEAEKFGINKDNAVNYISDAKGTNLNYQAVSDALSCYRSEKVLSKKWREQIDIDYKNRK